MQKIEDKFKEPEIIFPQETSGPPRKFPRLRKMAGGILVLVFAFMLGFLTGPESLDKTIRNVKSFIFDIKEKARPLKQKTQEIIQSKLPQKGVTPSSTQPTAPANEGDKPKRKIKYWGDPMLPTFRSDKPGKSPMNMDLIPFYEEEERTSGIKIDPAMTQNIGVKTEKARERTLTREIRTIGNVTYDERKVINIHTRYDGWIESMYVNFTGQEVKENELLVDIYSPQLVATQEEFLLAIKYQQALKDSTFPEIGKAAESLLESTRRRLELFKVPQHQIEELIRNKTIRETMHLHSHARGFVIEKNVLPGMYVEPDTMLYKLVDLSTIWVLADIYEYELPWVRLGQSAEMNLSYLPGKSYKGKITYIDPFLDPKTRTVKVRLEFSNPKWELKPEMYANITLKSVVAQKTVAVPVEAVIHSGERNLVVVLTPSGGF
ncbi:MAG: hypothetical protein A3K09_03530, partial [Nitrospinae bacterium RIFCSPLOWO2_12_FULL_47_7]